MAVQMLGSDGATIGDLNPTKKVPILAADLIGTNTGAANAAVTLTIPASGAGLFHYICAIEIMRAGAAALTGTAALVITTTNLPGALAWSVGNACPAGGTLRDVVLTFENPVKAVAANTATTIVCPAPGAGVLWRVTAYYFAAA